MKRSCNWTSFGRLALAAASVTAAGALPALAQSSSLLGDSNSRRPLTLATASWTYQAPAEQKQWKLNDFVTVMVEEKMKMIREGIIDQYKKVEESTTLKDWITLDGMSIVPDPQTAGDPKIGTAVDNKYRAQANLHNSDNFETSIQCTVVDIRPNGTLVIEGHAKVTIDEEDWELSLSGVVRPEDIMPNNTVKSEKIAEKQILRRSAGHGRDGMRRGWLQKLLDKFQLF
jgi:flagellar L-ring protein precursor FlgH